MLSGKVGKPAHVRLVDFWKEWAFTLSESGGFWAEKRQSLTQVLTEPLWLLQEVWPTSAVACVQSFSVRNSAFLISRQVSFSPRKYHMKFSQGKLKILFCRWEHWLYYTAVARHRISSVFQKDRALQTVLGMGRGRVLTQHAYLHIKDFGKSLNTLTPVSPAYPIWNSFVCLFFSPLFFGSKQSGSNIRSIVSGSLNFELMVYSFNLISK